MNVQAAVKPEPGKVWIFAGESSGDLYGARLAEALRRRCPALQLQGMGGPEMARAGVEILVDSSELGVVGLVEVLKMYTTFRRIFRDLVARAEAERPAAVVLIDYPGFNLRFAKQMKRRGIPVIYYISPQVWAWGKRRLPQMAACLRRMLVIFPFEVELYEKAGLPSEFVGHPLLELLRPWRENPPPRDENLVLLLPGSRFSEVDRLLGPLLATAAELARRRPGLRFVVPTPRERVRERVLAIIREQRASLGGLAVDVACGDTPDWMARASAGIAASGTVTVQAAMLGLPLVVVYRVNPLSYCMLRRLVKIPHFTMVNLVGGKLIYEEFLQGDVAPQVLVPALERILPGGARRAEVEAGMKLAVALLGEDRAASDTAAAAILRELGLATPGG